VNHFGKAGSDGVRQEASGTDSCPELPRDGKGARQLQHDIPRKVCEQDDGQNPFNFPADGAETGRTSSEKPNIQNIKNEAEYRAAFTARPGYKTLTLDYSGCELRIIAELSGRKSWIDTFRNEQDLHSVVAAFLKKQPGAAATEPDCQFAKDRHQCACPAT